jgi:hypothetical protein
MRRIMWFRPFKWGVVLAGMLFGTMRWADGLCFNFHLGFLGFGHNFGEWWLGVIPRFIGKEGDSMYRFAWSIRRLPDNPRVSAQ